MYTIYSIDDNQFYDINDYNITCKEEYYSINLYYMRETKENLFICSTNDGNLTMHIFDENFNYTNEYHGKVFGCKMHFL